MKGDVGKMGGGFNWERGRESKTEVRGDKEH